MTVLFMDEPIIDLDKGSGISTPRRVETKCPNCHKCMESKGIRYYGKVEIRRYHCKKCGSISTERLI